MEYTLDKIEARILGVLIEKQMTTPEYYPLTLNALANGCNQKSNRNPVMDLNENDVDEGLRRLRDKHLVWQVKAQGSRSLKFEHNMNEVFSFSTRELSLVCVLLLRGAQTVGELKSRTARMVEFQGLPAVEHTLQKLATHEKGPFVEKKERLPGQKEKRYAQLFCITPEEGEQNEGAIAYSAREEDPSLTDRVTEMEEKVDLLTSELEALKNQFTEFRKQFE